jgi:hypothetical protein
LRRYPNKISQKWREIAITSVHFSTAHLLAGGMMDLFGFYIHLGTNLTIYLGIYSTIMGPYLTIYLGIFYKYIIELINQLIFKISRIIDIPTKNIQFSMKLCDICNSLNLMNLDGV